MQNVIQPQKIEVLSSPTKILVCDSFFSEPFYTRLCEQFNKMLQRGFNEDQNSLTCKAFTRFGRTSGNFFSPYDAYGAALSDDACTFPVEDFWSLELYSWLHEQFSVPLLPDLSVGFHYHKAGSRSGEIHTDFATELICRKWLKNGLCISRTGPVDKKEFEEQEMEALYGARSIGLLYYLNNQDWVGGDGGETGFFDPISREVLHRVAPLNNRMVAFEVSPNSAHAFQHNVFKERCSLTAFLYSTPESREKKFGKRPPPLTIPPQEAAP